MRMFAKKLIGIVGRWMLLSRCESVDVGRASRVFGWRVRGAKGKLTVGSGSIIEAHLCFDRLGASIVVGDRVFIGNSLIAVADKVTVGDDVLISWGVTVMDHDAHSLNFLDRQNDVREWGMGLKNWNVVRIGEVKIKDKVWVGMNATILRGVTIGKGAVVAAESVVTKDVPPWVVVAGNPARVVRDISESAC